MGTHEVGGGCAVENGLDPLPFAIIDKGGAGEAGGHSGGRGRGVRGCEGVGGSRRSGRCRRIGRSIGWSGGHRRQGILNVQIGRAMRIEKFEEIQGKFMDRAQQGLTAARVDLLDQIPIAIIYK